MNTEVKKAILIFGGGILLFIAFKKIRPFGGKNKVSKSKAKESTMTDKRNAAIVIKAYSDATNAGEPKAFLDEMNGEFAKQYSMRVYTDKGTGKLFAADLDGNKIM